MKLMKGWKRIDKKKGFLNETTGQTLVVKKKEFGEHYLVLLFPQEETDDISGKKVSPEFPTESKAEAFALAWLKKNPNGTL
jgi:hypothetical protein